MLIPSNITGDVHVPLYSITGLLDTEYRHYNIEAVSATSSITHTINNAEVSKFISRLILIVSQEGVSVQRVLDAEKDYAGNSEACEIDFAPVSDCDSYYYAAIESYLKQIYVKEIRRASLFLFSECRNREEVDFLGRFILKNIPKIYDLMDLGYKEFLTTFYLRTPELSKTVIASMLNEKSAYSYVLRVDPTAKNSCANEAIEEFVKNSGRHLFPTEEAPTLQISPSAYAANAILNFHKSVKFYNHNQKGEFTSSENGEMSAMDFKDSIVVTEQESRNPMNLGICLKTLYSLNELMYKKMNTGKVTSSGIDIYGTKRRKEDMSPYTGNILHKYRELVYKADPEKKAFKSRLQKLFQRYFNSKVVDFVDFATVIKATQTNARSLDSILDVIIRNSSYRSSNPGDDKDLVQIVNDKDVKKRLNFFLDTEFSKLPVDIRTERCYMLLREGVACIGYLKKEMEKLHLTLSHFPADILEDGTAHLDYEDLEELLSYDSLWKRIKETNEDKVEALVETDQTGAVYYNSEGVLNKSLLYNSKFPEYSAKRGKFLKRNRHSINFQNTDEVKLSFDMNEINLFRVDYVVSYFYLIIAWYYKTSKDSFQVLVDTGYSEDALIRLLGCYRYSRLNGETIGELAYLLANPESRAVIEKLCEVDKAPQSMGTVLMQLGNTGERKRNIEILLDYSLMYMEGKMSADVDDSIEDFAHIACNFRSKRVDEVNIMSKLAGLEVLEPDVTINGNKADRDLYKELALLNKFFSGNTITYVSIREYKLNRNSISAEEERTILLNIRNLIDSSRFDKSVSHVIHYLKQDPKPEKSAYMHTTRQTDREDYKDVMSKINKLYIDNASQGKYNRKDIIESLLVTEHMQIDEELGILVKPDSSIKFNGYYIHKWGFAVALDPEINLVDLEYEYIRVIMKRDNGEYYLYR